MTLRPSTTALRVGDRMTVEVEVTNGTSEEKDVTVSVTLPEQLGYVSSDPPGFIAGGGPPPLGEFVGIPLGPVPAGETSSAIVVLEAVSAAPPGGVEVGFEAGGQGDVTSSSLVIDVLENDERVPGVLELEATGPSDPLAEVGDLLSYTLTVANTSERALENVIVVERVAPEVRVVAAPLVDGVDAVQVGRFLAKEDIVWVMDELDPGEVVRLPWRAVVQAPGDLEVTTSARATADRAQPATASAANFLASPDAPAAPVNPPFSPLQKRVAITVPVEFPASGTLPDTGLEAWGWALIGGAIALLGLTLYRFASPRARGKRVPAALLLLSIVAAACVSSSDSERPPSADGTPEVKGRRIERGAEETTVPPERNDEDRPEAGDGGDGADTQPEDDDADDPVEPDPDEPDQGDVAEVEPPDDERAPPPRQAGTVTRFVTRTVTLSELPMLEAPSTSGSSASFVWDEASRTITSATSSRLFVPGAPASVVTTVHDDGAAITVDVSLLNDSDDERLAVRGHLVHDVGESGNLARLRSDPIDTVLSPGGRITASFRYLLPAGNYQAGGSFVST